MPQVAPVRASARLGVACSVWGVCGMPRTLRAVLAGVVGWRVAIWVGAGVEWPWDRPSGQVSLEAFLSIVIAYYSVGAHVELRRGVRVIALAMLPLLAADLANAVAGYRSVSDGGGIYVLLVICWAVG